MFLVLSFVIFSFVLSTSLIISELETDTEELSILVKTVLLDEKNLSICPNCHIKIESNFCPNCGYQKTKK